MVCVVHLLLCHLILASLRECRPTLEDRKENVCNNGINWKTKHSYLLKAFLIFQVPLCFPQRHNPTTSDIRAIKHVATVIHRMKKVWKRCVSL